MTDRCSQCRHEVTDHRGYESPDGAVLCGSCYFALWGPSGAAEISRAVELLTPPDPTPPRRWR
jgi:hypothetical protein